MKVFDGVYADGSRKMRFTRSGATDKDNILRRIHKVTAAELVDKRFVGHAAGKVEAAQVAISRESGCFKLIGHRTHLTLRQFRFEQMIEDARAGLKRR